MNYSLYTYDILQSVDDVYQELDAFVNEFNAANPLSAPDMRGLLIKANQRMVLVKRTIANVETMITGAEFRLERVHSHEHN